MRPRPDRRGAGERLSPGGLDGCQPALGMPETQAGAIPGYREDLPWRLHSSIAVSRSLQPGLGNALSNLDVSPFPASGPRRRIQGHRE